jgi:uncharacterized protein
VLTIPVNAGFSCPNREGQGNSQGCTFCDNRSFSPVSDNSLPVVVQIQRAISRAAGKFDSFIVYLQPFSNTYGSVSQLSSIYEEIIAYPQVVGLSVGTRPDCFSEPVYEYLADVSKRTYLSIEIGLQSAHDDTLRLHCRGHSFDDFKQAVESLSRRGISTVAHVILGLPPETDGMMFDTARELARLPVDGVKIHQLMVIRGTPLHAWYEDGKLACLSLEKYAHLVSEFLSFLRPDQLIHRIIADSSIEKGLVAPLWSADKSNALRMIALHMAKTGIQQGSRWELPNHEKKVIDKNVE